MNTPHHFQLVDGTFTPEQAKQVLCAMVKSKIDFHSLERHSGGERSGESGHHSEERLRTLRGLDEELKALFAAAKAAGKRLDVKGSLEIAFVD